MLSREMELAGVALAELRTPARDVPAVGKAVGSPGPISFRPIHKSEVPDVRGGALVHLLKCVDDCGSCVLITQFRELCGMVGTGKSDHAELWLGMAFSGFPSLIDETSE